MITSNVSLECIGGNAVQCKNTRDAHLDNSREYNLTATGHLIVAICLGFIGTLGFINNLLVLLLFCLYKVLRSPINMLLMNISVSDLLVCVMGTPFSFAASTQGRWLIGESGCVWYGFVNSLFGTVSLISLALLSYERYITMMRTVEADATDYKKAVLGILVSWTYSLLWTLPPLFGWSSYGPEGPGTTCSVNWQSKSANSMSYIICFFTFCLVLPFMIIIYSYGKLLLTVKQVSGISTVTGRTREQRVLLMVVAMVICFLLCWLPYGIVALIATFGKPGLITPTVSIIPSVLAKSSTVYNPIIYVFMNNQFYRCFCSFVRCQKPTINSNSRSTSKTLKACRAAKMIHDKNFSFLVVSEGQLSTANHNPANGHNEVHGTLSVDETKPAASRVPHYHS
ncbi:pinopsin-like [Lepisosteus oculatus]|uniref:Pinopsin-like n=1 Tax=Lepisosteus oculatus TaxID=7918 RepID=W5MAS1_LEPOC|nr:PREDICTED: pinopsin-like [Lepisosteus oculatus]